MAIAIAPEMIAPVSGLMPNRTFTANPAPAILPILKASPPMTMRIAMKCPRPGSTLLATSCPRMPLIVMTRHTFICAPISMTIDARMAKAKLAPNFSVNTAVCVKNPGPIADVAMRKTAPKRIDHLVLPEASALAITSSAILQPSMIYAICYCFGITAVLLPLQNRPSTDGIPPENLTARQPVRATRNRPKTARRKPRTRPTESRGVARKNPDRTRNTFIICKLR